MLPNINILFASNGNLVTDFREVFLPKSNPKSLFKNSKSIKIKVVQPHEVPIIEEPLNHHMQSLTGQGTPKKSIASEMVSS
jgi:hypothetical protein